MPWPNPTCDHCGRAVPRDGDGWELWGCACSSIDSRHQACGQCFEDGEAYSEVQKAKWAAERREYYRKLEEADSE